MIPDTAKLERHFTCWVAHAGVCVRDDRLLVRPILSIAQGLRKKAWTEGTSGCFYALQQELPPGPWIEPRTLIAACLAFKRGSDPEIAIFAKLSLQDKTPSAVETCMRPCRDGHEIIFEADCGTVKRLLAVPAVVAALAALTPSVTPAAPALAVELRLC